MKHKQSVEFYKLLLIKTKDVIKRLKSENIKITRASLSIALGYAPYYFISLSQRRAISHPTTFSYIDAILKCVEEVAPLQKHRPKSDIFIFDEQIDPKKIEKLKKCPCVDLDKVLAARQRMIDDPCWHKKYLENLVDSIDLMDGAK